MKKDGYDDWVKHCIVLSCNDECNPENQKTIYKVLDCIRNSFFINDIVFVISLPDHSQTGSESFYNENITLTKKDQREMQCSDRFSILPGANRYFHFYCNDCGRISEKCENDSVHETALMKHRFGSFVGEPSINASLVLKDILLPLMFQENQSGHSLIPTGTCYVNCAETFVSALGRAVTQSERHIALTLPSFTLQTLYEKSDREEEVNVIESFAGEWLCVITQVVADEANTPHGETALDELEFWRFRFDVLSNLTAQITSDMFVTYLDYLRPSYQVVSQIDDVIQKVSSALIEASDSLKYLCTLEHYLRQISSSSCVGLVEIFSRLFESLKRVWIFSRFYGSETRMLPLLERISRQIFIQVAKQIDIRGIIQGNFTQSHQCLSEAQHVFKSWQSSYLEIKAQIENDGNSQRKWEFDKTRLFASTSYAINIFDDMIEIIEVIAQLERFLRPELIAVTGEDDELVALKNHVKNLSTMFSSLSFDIFDSSHFELWESKMTEFHENVKVVELEACNFIVLSFQRLRSSSEGAFNLVQNFTSVRSRPIIHSFIDERYTDILHRYMKELDNLTRMFELNKDNPSKMACAILPSRAAAVAWALYLYNKAKRPIIAFQRRKDYLDVGIGITARRRYLSFARSVEKYNSTIYSSWIEEDCQNVTKLLKSSVLRSDIDDNICIEAREKWSKLSSKRLEYLRQDSIPKYSANFPDNVCVCIEEAKYFSELGYSIPPSILEICLQSEGLIHDKLIVEDTVTRYNRIACSLTIIEKMVLQDHLTSLLGIFHPGLESINWNSLLISNYAKECDQALSKFELKLGEVRKITMEIEELICQMASCSLIDAELFYVKATDCNNCSQDVASMIEIQCKQRTNELLQRYRKFFPLLLNVELSVCETNSGMSNNLHEYYQLWEKRIFNALLEITFRSLLVIANAIESEENTLLLNICACMKMGSLSMEINPSLLDIEKYFKRSINGLLDMSKSFIRWKRGTCIEASCKAYFDKEGNETHISYSYYDDIIQNPIIVRALSYINDKIKNMIHKIEIRCQDWKTFLSDKCFVDQKQATHRTELLEHSPGYDLFDTMISDFKKLGYAVCQIFDPLLRMICNLPPISFKSGLVEISFEPFAKQLASHINRSKNNIIETLHLIGQRHLGNINETMEGYQHILEKCPCDLNDLSDVLKCINNIAKHNLSIESSIFRIDEMYRILQDHEASIDPAEIQAVNSLHCSWQNLYSFSKTKDLRLSKLKENYRAVTRSEVVAFASHLSKELTDFELNGPGSPGLSLIDGLNLMNEWKIKMTHLEQRAFYFLNAETLLSIPNSDFNDLKIIQNEMVNLGSIYSIYDHAKNIVLQKSSLRWDDTSVDEAKLEINKVEAKCKSLGILRKSCTFKAAEAYIKTIKASLSVMSLLKGQALELHHWKALWKLSSSTTYKNCNELTLGDIMHMQLGVKLEEVTSIINQANQEAKISNEINNIARYWNSFSLELKDMGENRYFLVINSDLLSNLEDHMLNLQAIVGSRFAARWTDLIQHWEQKLHTINECIEIWIIVQQKQLYLQNIFCGSDDIRTQLSVEANCFDDAVGVFIGIMNDVLVNSNIVRCCCAAERQSALNELSKKLDFCQKRLSNYLDSKRNIYPRFYFISDDELLDLLGSSSEPRSINAHVTKIMENVRTIVFEHNFMKGISSDEGELVKFKEVISCVGSTECWMITLEEEIKRSLWAYTKSAIYFYAENERDKWIFSVRTLGMNTVISTQVWWTWKVESAFKAIKAGNKRSLKVLENNMTADIQFLVTLIRDPLDEITRKKVNTLLIIDVHAKDIVSSFVRESISEVDQFEWESQLRFYWDKDEDDIIIKQCTGRFCYGYEYLGLSNRLVITPLTDRCYMTLTQALTFNMGGSLAGPAGTGKTETVKDLAKSLSLPCFVINCGEGLDYHTMASFFSGLTQSGAWGCFDEFNRINVEVLSVVSAQLKAIQNALATRSPIVDIGAETTLNIKHHNGFATCGFFITMNPGYAGRTELPDNLKALFRPITMAIPDFLSIAENILFSEGFEGSKELAKKIVILYKLCKEQLSKQHFYDFGLRAMKTVLVMAGKSKRSYPDIPEDKLLFKTLCDANIPKFKFDDVPLFLQLLQDLFPNTDTQDDDKGNFHQHIISCLNINNSLPSDKNTKLGQIEKIIEIYEMQSVRHTIMVVGPTGGGKSFALNTLAQSKCSYDNVSIKMHILNPKAQNLNELYGMMDPLSREWTDGILSKVFRRINQPLPTGKGNEIRWLVFDGDVDALWVENLNSVMDDNKLLTLPNGERIRLQPYCSMIFEVADLQFASPATISRCGMVWVDPRNLGYFPYYESWLKNYVDNESSSHTVLTYGIEGFTKLFNCYFTPMVELVLDGIFREVKERKLVLIHPTTNICMCEQLCHMLDAHILQSTENLNVCDIEALFIYCVVWSAGAQLHQTSRPKFEYFLKSLTGPLVKFPESGESIFECFYCTVDRCWKTWKINIQPYEQPNPFDFHKIFVPTISSTIYSDLLFRCLSRKPSLLIGEQGTSKTTMMSELLRRLPRDVYVTSSLALSSRTTSIDVQKVIEGNVEKRMGHIYGPKLGKRLVTFVDDIHMPKVDIYGTQQAVAFLLTLLDHGFIYDRSKDFHQKELRDLDMLVAASSPTCGRSVLDPRFVSRFNVFCVSTPNDDEIETLFNKITLSYFRSHLDLESDLRSITKATLKIFHAIRAILPPTPTKFHYIFSLSDISRIFEGLCSLRINDQPISSLQLLRRWRYEVNISFLNRLSTSSDTMEASSLISKIVRADFSGVSTEILRDPLMLADFAKHESNQINSDQCDDCKKVNNYEDFRSFFCSMIDEYNRCSSTEPLQMILFDNAIMHLLRLMHILKKPRGNALLIGLGGIGKQTLTKLAAYASKYNLFRLSIRRNYSRVDLQDDLKNLCKQLISGPVVFLLSDSDILEEDFLEYTEKLIKSGFPLDLFDCEDQEFLMKNVTPTGTNVDHDIILLLERCRSNLRMVMTMSPSGDKLRLRCRNFPSLVSACNIDWYSPWPSEALRQIASVNLCIKDKCSEVVFKEVVNHMTHTHSIMLEYSKRFREIVRRPYHITPTHFMDYIENFNFHIEESSNGLSVSIDRYNVGLSKIIDTSVSVEHMKLDLIERKAVVDAKTSEIETLISEIKRKKEIANTSNAEASNKQLATEEQANAIIVEKTKADGALMEALPAVEAAAEALNNIRREDLQELKAFNNPPIHVKIVCQMCAVLRPTKEKLGDTWTDSKKMLGNPKLLECLKDYPKECLTEKMYRICTNILKENIHHEITVENLETKSKAGKGLLIWVLAILRYYEVAKNVDPLRAKVKKMEKAQAKTESELSLLKKRLDSLEKEILSLHTGYNDATTELTRLQSQATKMESRLLSASKLVNGLADERKRWSESVELLIVKKGMVLGDCLLRSGFLSYMGAFTTSYRSDLLDKLKSDILYRSIPITSDLNILESLTSDTTRQNWITNGLPSDSYSMENAIFTVKGHRFPLCIDPQMQACSWIKRLYKGLQLYIKSMDDQDFLKYLELAVQFGKPFLFVNVGKNLDPLLDPILNRRCTNITGAKTVLLGGRRIEWDDGFRLFLCTQLSNPSYPPEITSKVTLVNYCITMGGLSDHLLNVVVTHERPELQKQFDSIIADMSKNTELVTQLEDLLLEDLSSATGSLLDNNKLIETLESTKHSSTKLKLQIEKCKRTSSSIISARNKYRGIATRGAILYFASSDLCQINFMYEQSLNSFLLQFKMALTEIQPATEEMTQIDALISVCTRRIYDYTCTGLFDKDKLTFSFRLACLILQERKELDISLLDAFIRGNVNFDQSLETCDESLIWISKNGWKDLLHLSSIDESFKSLKAELIQMPREFNDWSENETPEISTTPGNIVSTFTPIQKLCFMRVFRPDRCYNAVKVFICQILGDYFIQPPILNFNKIFTQSNSSSPILVMLSSGADPLSDIFKCGESVGYKVNENIICISLGQGQGPVALNAIKVGIEKGHWVILQNCHLLVSWLQQLNTFLDDLENPHKNFRLWLTTEPSNNFPISILQKSIKVVTEPPDGIKLNMRSTLHRIDDSIIDDCNHPRYIHLLYILSFLHAVVQERRKYGKVGWNVGYDFNESDFDVSQKLISLYLNRSNSLDDSHVPFESIKYLIGEVMYGGRVSDHMDRRILVTYLNEYMGDFVFDPINPFSFCRESHQYTLPSISDIISIRDCQRHLEQLPLDNSPSVIGLHPNAEISFFMERSRCLWDHLILFQSSALSSFTDNQDSTIVDTLNEIRSKIPLISLDIGSIDTAEVRQKILSSKKLSPKAFLSPYDVVLLQELERWNRLCIEMMTSLELLEKVLLGEVVMTDNLEALLRCISDGTLPKAWRKFAPMTQMKLGSWMLHFTKRFEQYCQWISRVEKGSDLTCVWLGGFHVPESYLTALLQISSRKNHWPLDQCSLYTRVTKLTFREEFIEDDVSVPDKNGILVYGLFLEGAGWDHDRSELRLQDPKQLIVELPIVHVTAAMSDTHKSNESFLAPVYVTPSRSNAAGEGLVFEAFLSSRQHHSIWTLQGVALSLNPE